MQTYEQRELARIAWQKELNVKLELYYGKNIFLSLKEGRVKSITDLKLVLNETEWATVVPQLKQACIDVDAILTKGGSPPNPLYILGYRYPKHFQFGDEVAKRYGLIQILI